MQETTKWIKSWQISVEIQNLKHPGVHLPLRQKDTLSRALQGTPRQIVEGRAGGGAGAAVRAFRGIKLSSQT